jgi:hypothetical protein
MSKSKTGEPLTTAVEWLPALSKNNFLSILKTEVPEIKVPAIPKIIPAVCQIISILLTEISYSLHIKHFNYS